MANIILKMSIFQMSLIFQLLFYVNGAEENLSAYVTEHHSDSRLNVTGINRIVGGSPASIKDFPFMIKKPFRLTPYVNYVPLPEKYDPDLIAKYSDKPECIVVGWGRTKFENRKGSTILQYAKVPLIPRSTCSRYSGYHHAMHDQICAGFEEGGVDSCQGDSGGPLLCGGVQVGIISWGLKCAAPRAPGVYVRVDNYLQWINHTIMRSDGPSTVSHQLALITLLMLVWKLGL